MVIVRILLLCLLAGPALAQAQLGLPKDGGGTNVTIGQPVTLTVMNRPIVTLRAKVGSIDAAQRVQAQSDRIADIPYRDLLDETSVKPASLGALSGFWIFVGDNVAIGLLPQDVDPQSAQTLEELAASAATRLAHALEARHQQRQPLVLLRGVVLSVVATVLFVAMVWLIGRLRDRGLRALERLRTPKPLVVRGFDLRPHLRSFEHGVVKSLALVCWLVTGYVWLTFVLLQFPYTEPWGNSLGAWLRGEILALGEGVLHAIPGLFRVVVIFLITRAVARGVNAFFYSIESGRLKVDWFEPESARVTRRLTVALIWVFALTVAYPYIPGSGSDAFKGISVLIGLMISLGSAGFVNQIMSGLVIVYSRTFRPGDFVMVGEKEGTISHVGLLSTKMITPTRQEITIPNAVAVGNQITNYSRLAETDRAIVFTTSVTIGYDTPWRQVHAMLLMAAERTDGILAEPRARVLQEALSDFYVQYDLLFAIEHAQERRRILSDLHAKIQDVFNEHGVQIMSPHFHRQPEQQVLVPPEAWYAAPAQPPAAT